jgi:capsular polysaccharide biosynthesis protein
MSKPKFTFGNYFKELKKSWILLAVFTIIGAAAGAYYAFTKPTQYTANSKFIISNSLIDNGTAISPYSQVGDAISSRKILSTIVNDAKDFPDYSIVEDPRGVFNITVTDNDSENAKKVANTIVNSAKDVIEAIYDNANYYKVTVAEEAEEANPTVTAKTRIISIVVAAVAMFAIAAIIVFIKFDYNSEK